MINKFGAKPDSNYKIEVEVCTKRANYGCVYFVNATSEADARKQVEEAIEDEWKGCTYTTREWVVKDYKMWEVAKQIYYEKHRSNK
jgi:hypothetical protein